MTDSKTYASTNYAFLLDLLRKLCIIPAPSHHEEKRAEFCKNFLEECGAENVYIDSAKNVIYPVNCEKSTDITVFVAHTDTVFPDTDPYNMTEDENKIYCPGIGDDSASVAVLLMLAKYVAENKIKPSNGVLIVLNSCEEGLGNLLGTKTFMNEYAGRIGRFISFDSGKLNVLCDTCVGSHRYKVEVTTQGGHSFMNFGKKSSIAELSGIISKIYSIEVPSDGNSRTTYNVGTIEGGTSVNTISQYASMLCEYRSDSKKCLDIMKKRFHKIFEDSNTADINVNFKLIGERPCMGEIDKKKQVDFVNMCTEVIETTTNEKVYRVSGSTDCNIPLSIGIPAVCIGVYTGNGAHTREEYISKDSLLTGLELALNLFFYICNIS